MDILCWDFQFSLWDKEGSYGGFISTIEIPAGRACWLHWSAWGPEETFGHWLWPFGCHWNRLIGKRGIEKRRQVCTDRCGLLASEGGTGRGKAHSRSLAYSATIREDYRLFGYSSWVWKAARLSVSSSSRPFPLQGRAAKASLPWYWYLGLNNPKKKTSIKWKCSHLLCPRHSNWLSIRLVVAWDWRVVPGGLSLLSACIVWYDTNSLYSWRHGNSSRAGGYLHTGREESQVLQGEVYNGWARVLDGNGVARSESRAVPDRDGCHGSWWDH